MRESDHRLKPVAPNEPIRVDPLNAVVDVAIRQRSSLGPGQVETPVGTATISRPAQTVAGAATLGFATITSVVGSTVPYRYSARDAVMDSNGGWSDAPDAQDYENVFNMEEQGGGGQWVNPLLVGDVVTISAAPGGADAYVCQRAHYRGTY